jgi:hypothetical protein
VLTAEGLSNVSGGHLFGADRSYLPDHCFWYYNASASEVWDTDVEALPHRDVDGRLLDLATLYS